MDLKSPKHSTKSTQLELLCSRVEFTTLLNDITHKWHKNLTREETNKLKRKWNFSLLLYNFLTPTPPKRTGNHSKCTNLWYGYLMNNLKLKGIYSCFPFVSMCCASDSAVKSFLVIVPTHWLYLFTTTRKWAPSVRNKLYVRYIFRGGKRKKGRIHMFIRED